MTIATDNQAWGFYGTLKHGGLTDAEATVAYDQFARNVLVGEYSMEADDARKFLDSRVGRHLADALATRTGFDFENLPGWLHKEVRRYYTWR